MHWFFFLLPLLIVVFASSNSTWAPGQSDQVKAICKNMTKRERRRAVGRGALFGLALGGVLGLTMLVGLLVGKQVFDSALKGALVAQPTALILIGVAFWKLRPQVEKSQREFLASTQWSRAQGFTPDEITLRGA